MSGLVVSLRRDSAQAMGYDNLKAWRDLVKRQTANIAKSQKIEMKNLRGLSENPLAGYE